jgi:thiamine-monophosphate kinase
VKGEFEFIAGLRARVAADAHADLIAGIGDDAAILRPSANSELLITTDLLVEEIHFDLSYTSPAQLGHKALAVNLSDIAAMGGRPRYFLLGFACPRPLAEGFLDNMIDAMMSLAREHGVALIGGDTCTARRSLFINITLIGECAPGKSVRRNTARPGDSIYITGALGGSALGLDLLRSGIRFSQEGERDEKTAALSAHLLPQPRVELGAAIGERGLATAMIDISDGLSSDLNHICDESGVGAEVDAEAIRIASGASLKQALNGGEDYELLFTVSPDRVAEIETLRTDFPNIEISKIGSITTSQERWLISEGKRYSLIPRGYDHFA